MFNHHSLYSRANFATQFGQYLLSTLTDILCISKLPSPKGILENSNRARDNITLFGGKKIGEVTEEIFKNQNK